MEHKSEIPVPELIFAFLLIIKSKLELAFILQQRRVVGYCNHIEIFPFKLSVLKSDGLASEGEINIPPVSDPAFDPLKIRDFVTYAEFFKIPALVAVDKILSSAAGKLIFLRRCRHKQRFNIIRTCKDA